MRILLSALALLLALAPGLRAEVTVRLAGGRVDIVANTAPLSEVLDRLARQTGMKVVYDGPAPRQLVTVSLLGRVPAEAVHDLLAGQGLNYAFVSDATGTGVQTLLMTGSAGPARSASTAPVGPRRPAPPPMSGADAMDESGGRAGRRGRNRAAAGQRRKPSAGHVGPAQGMPGLQNPGTVAPGVLPPGIVPAAPSPEGTPAPGTGPATGQPNMPSSFPRPSPPPPYINPRFSPASPLSPLGPFAPVVPGSPPGTPPGTVPPPQDPDEDPPAA